ncbi:MAG: YkgJ family cysteine cluster protein [Deltaproteobacteria bacterium]|nr:YkgJ family cysteine cluster protein [Deltaproteobacteria bacterium]
MKQKISNPTNNNLTEITKLLDSGGKKDFVRAVELALRQVLLSLHVEEHFKQLIQLLREEHWYQNLEGTWEILNPQVRTREWKILMNHLVEIAYASRPYCLRCGECCLHGSPSLHLEDTDLVIQGILSPQDLYTLRKGERAKLNAEGKLGMVQQEAIKIREKPENGQCIFYSEQDRECAIYQHRPLQCKLQACWDPESLNMLLHMEKLSRRYLLEGDEAKLKLIHVHDERCSPEELDNAFSIIDQGGDEAALDRILEILRYDTALRAVLTEKGGFRVEELDFFFGRSIQEIVGAYGMRVDRHEDGTYHLVSLV